MSGPAFGVATLFGATLVEDNLPLSAKSQIGNGGNARSEASAGGVLTTTVGLSSSQTGPSVAGGAARLRWWREVLFIAVFYAAYTAIRDVRGTRPVSATVAVTNAHKVVSFERALSLFHEAQIQHWVLHDRFLVEALDVWYGSTHFLVTAAVLIVLFFVYPGHYRRWRNTLAIATTFALIGFAFFPLMPPRLLPAGYGFTDTLRTVGGLWAFNSGPMPRLTDQFAAMPSLHFAWALWSGVALAGLVRRGWAKALALLYPAITLLCVIATGNHYFVDAIAGAIIIGIGYGFARAGVVGGDSRSAGAPPRPRLPGPRWAPDRSERR